jgi:hypothetical protein
MMAARLKPYHAGVARSALIVKLIIYSLSTIFAQFGKIYLNEWNGFSFEWLCDVVKGGKVLI